MYRRAYRGMGDPITGPVSLPAGAPAAGPSVAPAGMWVNPADTSQWLSQSDAAKLGGFCFGGMLPGRYRVSGNYSNSVLTCGALPTSDLLVYFGAAAVAAYFLLPPGMKWLSIIPAGYGAVVAGAGGLS
jgi:hypothetical protein